ncbi:MAG TPA: hypothetical protein VGL68_03825 [Solirubrobacteraceae bacterium]|jgi:hypothetical protein
MKQKWIACGVAVYMAGIGLLIGVGFAEPKDSKEAAGAVAALVVAGVAGAGAEMMKKGLADDDHA